MDNVQWDNFESDLEEGLGRRPLQYGSIFKEALTPAQIVQRRSLLYGRWFASADKEQYGLISLTRVHPSILDHVMLLDENNDNDMQILAPLSETSGDASLIESPFFVGIRSLMERNCADDAWTLLVTKFLETMTFRSEDSKLLATLTEVEAFTRDRYGFRLSEVRWHPDLLGDAF